jgi:hypothetical protein
LAIAHLLAFDGRMLTGDANGLKTRLAEWTRPVTDLYDFAYDGGTGVRQGAALQAGFGTLGNGGRVFRVHINLAHTITHEHRYGDLA